MAKVSKFKDNKEIERQVLEYYENGYSQKDIREALRVPILQIRNILLANNISTKNYRAIDVKTKNIIRILINENYSYRKISMLLDISFHVIRETTDEVLVDDSKKGRKKRKKELYEDFLNEYEAGDSFLYLYDKYDLSSADILPLSKPIINQEGLLARHQENLEKRIIDLLNEGKPVHMIAKSLNISVSIVKGKRSCTA